MSCLCQTKAPTINKVFPLEHYHNEKNAKHLWTQAIVKLVLEEKTGNDYQMLTQQYYDASQDHNRVLFSTNHV